MRFLVKFSLLFFVMFAWCLSTESSAQDSRIIFLENEFMYELIGKLQQRNIIRGLNPDDLPYHYQEVMDEIERIDQDKLAKFELNWLHQLEKALASATREHDTAVLHLGMEGSIEVNNTMRKQVYRPYREEEYIWPALEANPSLQRSGLVLNANVKFEFFYDRDPDGIDAVNRWYTRNENGYVGYTNRFLEVYAGRFATHWGNFGRGAGLISENPYSYDKFDLKLKTNYFEVHTLFGFLDNIDATDVFNGDTRLDPLAKKRFIAAKRVDWRPNKDLMFSYRESVLYSGYRAIPEPKYLLPVNVAVFQADNTPKNDIVNLIFGLSVWKRINRFTVQTEILVDDLIFNRVERGITERGTFSWIFNAKYAFKKDPIQLEITNEIISYQTYNTDQAEGRYLYLGKGLAAPFNDYVFTEVKSDFFLDEKITGLRVSPYAGWLLQGEQEINQPFTSSYADGSPFEFVLTGEVEETFRFATEVFYAPMKHLWAKLNIGINHVNSRDHIAGKSATRLVGMAEVGFRYSLKYVE